MLRPHKEKNLLTDEISVGSINGVQLCEFIASFACNSEFAVILTSLFIEVPSCHVAPGHVTFEREGSH